MLAERLEEITKNFSRDRDSHYREQMQAIQIDMNLIMEADAYGEKAIKDQPDEIDNLVLDHMKTMRKQHGPIPPPRAGKMYAEFAKEVNDAIEERDAMLAVHRVCSPSFYSCHYLIHMQRDYDVKMIEIAGVYEFRRKLAAGEHSALSSTLRDRLINSVTNKKNRLARDKETVEIGDSNALLMHPSQYGLANPASPGGLHTKRATRHRREADDLTTFTESNKRKRKAADSDESPAPTRQRLDNGTRTPLWFAEKRDLTSRQVDSALYSIGKLFSDRELSMTYNDAALAAHSYMQRHQPYSENLESPPNGQLASTEDLGAAIDPDNQDADSPPGGTTMERQFSHATRSTRGANLPNYISGLGIDALGDLLHFPNNMNALIKGLPKMPPPISSLLTNRDNKRDNYNYPSGLSPDDATAELELIRQARKYNEIHGLGRNLEAENGGRPLLEAASAPYKYQYWVTSDNKELLEKAEEEAAAKRKVARKLQMGAVGGELGGESMSRNPSGNGVGGVAMSRQGTGEATSSRGRKITKAFPGGL